MTDEQTLLCQMAAQIYAISEGLGVDRGPERMP